MSGGKITTGAWQIGGGGTEVILSENLTYAGALYEDGDSTIALNGHVLTLSGAVDSAGGYSGQGTVLVSGTLNDDNDGNGGSGLTIGSGVTLELSGVADDGPNGSGDVSFNLDSTGTLIATLQIDATGVFDFTGDSGAGRSGSTGIVDTRNSTIVDNGNSTIVDNGLVEKTGGSGSNYVDPTFTEGTSGTIAIQSGFMYFRGNGNVFSGSITTAPGGYGNFALGGYLGGSGSDTLARGATITTSGWVIQDNGTQVTLGEDLAYSGSLYQEIGTNILLQGYTLTLSGSVSSTGGFYGGTVDGGRVVVSGAFVSSNDNGVGANDNVGSGPTVGSGVTLEVSGVVTDGPNSRGDVSFTLGSADAPSATLQIGNCSPPLRNPG